MTLQLIILAGGKGTRISPVIGETPKILANISGKPFLEWFINWVETWNIKINPQILLSTGKGHNIIEDYCKKNNHNLICVKEKVPLGTFGAISNVASKYYSEDYLILNGDTIFDANFNYVYEFYKKDQHNNPLILLKEDLNNKSGGYKKIKSKWYFSLEKTNNISLGGLLISFKKLKEIWTELTSIPFENNLINKFIKKELMIDQDCFSKNPVNAITFRSDISFLDIGIPSSYSLSQSYIPKFIENLKKK
tara:strand:+ start:180 stop:929 length:750 start_codon:yes stop_codon:yes gene_type:complete